MSGKRVIQIGIRPSVTTRGDAKERGNELTKGDGINQEGNNLIGIGDIKLHAWDTFVFFGSSLKKNLFKNVDFHVIGP